MVVLFESETVFIRHEHLFRGEGEAGTWEYGSVGGEGDMRKKKLRQNAGQGQGRSKKKEKREKGKKKKAPFTGCVGHKYRKRDHFLLVHAQGEKRQAGSAGLFALFNLSSIDFLSFSQ